MVNLTSKYKYVLFDLDGTLSESAPGIRMSLEKAITALGKPLPDLDDYTLYIGPPLIDTFRGLCKFNEEECARGVELYREYYNSQGKLINKLYSGIADLLESLVKCGAKLAVCSSKYERFADEIVTMLEIRGFFTAVCGSTLDGSRKDKKDLIPYAVESLGGNFPDDKENTVMIGDTHFDAAGAKICGIDFIGAGYGYGTIDMMRTQGAELFANSPSELKKFLINH